MEVGFAAAVGIPIFATHAPNDLTLREYVIVVPTLSAAMRKVEASSRSSHREGVLIDPHASVEEAHTMLDRIKTALTREGGMEEPAPRVYADLLDLRQTLALPTRVQ
jgi:hypothetical protein